jgi:hypothetical protein
MQRPNKDKPHGDNIRISGGSGIFLDEPPFSIPAQSYRLLLEVPGILPIDGTDSGVIRTYVLNGVPSIGDRPPRQP